MKNNVKVTKHVGKYRSSRPEVFCKKGVLKNLAKFTGTPVPESPEFSCKFVKFLRTPFFYRTPLVATSGSNTCKCIGPNKIVRRVK